MKATHVPALDGLRGLAIIMVLFVHFVGDATPSTAMERAVVKLANYGIWGVDLFFVLSGFLITGILYDSKNGPSYFKNFYVRRTLRIFPLYYATLALLFVVLPVLPFDYPRGLDEAARHQSWLWPYGTNIYVSMHHGWVIPYVSHFWSLAVEEHFYLLWPVVVLLSSRRVLVGICIGGAAFALALRCTLSLAGAGEVALVALTPCRLDALLVGASLAIATRWVAAEALMRMARRGLWVSSALIALASGWNAASNGALRDVVLPLRGTLVALAFGALLVITMTASRTSFLGRLFQSAIMRLFGKYSYGLYVIHGIIAFGLIEPTTEHAMTAALGSHAAAMLLLAGGGAAASLALAMASYELFEKHLLRLKDRLAPSVALAALGIVLTCMLTACVPSREAPSQKAAAAMGCASPPASPVPLALDGSALLVPPSPLVSRHKNVVGWAPAPYAEVQRVVDGDYRSSWEAGRPTPGAPAWVSMDIGVGPTRVLVSWIAAGSYNYDETDYGSPGAYHIDTSADSTNGANGTWRTAVNVPAVKTNGEAHLLDFTGQRWVKLVVTGVPAVSPNGVQISEVDVHDASGGTRDTWFFMGDSITAFAFDRAPTHEPSFAECVHGRHVSYFPAMFNGGVGGDKSDEGAARVSEWLARNPDAHFWAIGYGSNDSAGDSNDTSSFRSNMLSIVRAVRAAGRVPILARIPYASDGQHDNVPSYNRVIDEIRTESSLPPGPDLYAWFMAHPEELRDGLHPNDRGIVSMNRLWADAMESVYPR